MAEATSLDHKLCKFVCVSVLLFIQYIS